MDCIVLPVCCFTQKHSGNSQRFLFQSHIGIGKTLGLILGAIVYITTSHRTAKARMDAFISTCGKPSSQISLMLSSSEKDIVKKNQEFLTSIIKCVEFCGRQGLVLGGHRDDSTTVDKKH